MPGHERMRATACRGVYRSAADLTLLSALLLARSTLKMSSESRPIGERPWSSHVQEGTRNKLTFAIEMQIELMHKRMMHSKRYKMGASVKSAALRTST
jgi:hypothetical protein